MNKNLEILAKTIKKNGCALIVEECEIITKSNSAGYFDIEDGSPVIRIAKYGQSMLEFSQLLLHEYAHFLQWKDGFLPAIDDICDGWDILDRWLAGEEFGHEQLYVARNSILLIEYDAEIRTVELAKKFHINIGGASYFNNAHSYISSIKDAFRRRQWGQYTILNMHYRKLKPLELLAPLTPREIAKIEKGPA